MNLLRRAMLASLLCVPFAVSAVGCTAPIPDNSNAVTAPMAVSFHVAEQQPVMKRLYDYVGKDKKAHKRGVSASTDGWQHDNSGRTFSDYFLRASDRDGLTGKQVLSSYVDDLFRRKPALAPSADHKLFFEHVRSSRRGDFWRTHLVRSQPAIAKGGVEQAAVVTDPQTAQPAVEVTFTDEASQVWTATTSRNVGQRIVIVVNDTVVSAPVIQAPIRSSRVTISVGATDADQAKRQAQQIVRSMR